MTAIITIKNGKKVVSNGMNEEKVLLDGIDLTINKGDFYGPWWKWCGKKYTVQHDRRNITIKSRVDRF